MKIIFKPGIPDKDGWYLVKLIPGHTDPIDKDYDVDWCCRQGLSDGGGRTWAKWYPSNIEAWAELPKDTNKNYRVDDRSNDAVFFKRTDVEWKKVATLNREAGPGDQCDLLTTWDGDAEVTAWAMTNGYKEDIDRWRKHKATIL